MSRYRFMARAAKESASEKSPRRVTMNPAAARRERALQPHGTESPGEGNFPRRTGYARAQVRLRQMKHAEGVNACMRENPRLPREFRLGSYKPGPRPTPRRSGEPLPFREAEKIEGVILMHVHASGYRAASVTRLITRGDRTARGVYAGPAARTMAQVRRTVNRLAPEDHRRAERALEYMRGFNEAMRADSAGPARMGAFEHSLSRTQPALSGCLNQGPVPASPVNHAGQSGNGASENYAGMIDSYRSGGNNPLPFLEENITKQYVKVLRLEPLRR